MFRVINPRGIPILGTEIPMFCRPKTGPWNSRGQGFAPWSTLSGPVDCLGHSAGWGHPTWKDGLHPSHKLETWLGKEHIDYTFYTGDFYKYEIHDEIMFHHDRLYILKSLILVVLLLIFLSFCLFAFKKNDKYPTRNKQNNLYIYNIGMSWNSIISGNIMNHPKWQHFYKRPRVV